MSIMALREKFNQKIDQTFFWLLNFLSKALFEIGGLTQFAIYSFRSFFNKPYRFKELIQQMEFIGNQSVFIIVLTGTFTGMAMSFQIYLGFRRISATSLVGPTVAMGIARELGPVLSGLIVSARAGGAMAANIGSMRVSEQIDALEVIGVDPKEYLVSPRLMASLLSMPLLTGVFDFVAMVGSFLLCTKVLDIDEAVFWDKTALWLEPSHIYEGLIKAAVFGVVFATICCYRGFNTKGGARGVGEATNKGVVISMVMIIILDFFIMNLIDIYYKFTA